MILSTGITVFGITVDVCWIFIVQCQNCQTRYHSTEFHQSQVFIFISQILDLVEKVENDISHLSSECQNCDSCHDNIEVPVTLFRTLPVLIQYTQLYQCLVTHAISAHRSTAKLLSVLLAIFTALTTKVLKYSKKLLFR